MIAVQRWTGREAAALRHARRMSIRAYAAHLGVAVATVSNWDSRGEHAQLNTQTQQLLDIDLDRASDAVRQRFAAILGGEADVKRRGFLVGSVSLAGALASAALPAGVGPSPMSPRLAATVARLSRAILAPVPDTTTRPVTAAGLAADAQQAWQLRQRAEYEALGAMLSELIPQAEAYRPERSDQDGVRAGEALVHAYNTASSLLKRLGDDSLAAITADRAVRAAQSLDIPT